MSGRATDPVLPSSGRGAELLLAACESEGVLSLMHPLLSAPAFPIGISPELLQPLAVRARGNAVRSMLCVSEARRIQQALQAAGIQALWLKGIALGQWLYPAPHLRDLADIDLLLPDHATTLRAAEVLAPLGFVLPNPHIAGDLVVHELLAWSPRTQLELDLHWDLSNHALFAGRLPWDALWADAQPLPGLGAGAQGLGAVHSLLHACVHRALNGLTAREDRLRWLYDIHLLAGALDTAQWQRFSGMAIAAGIADPAFEALRASGRIFATTLPRPVLCELEAAAHLEPVRTIRLREWAYLQRNTWRHLPDLRTRLLWLRQLLLPDMAHLRARYGGDGAGATRVIARRMTDGWQRWRGYHRAVE